MLSHEKYNKGFSLVEVILASSIFSLMITGIVGAVIYGKETVAVGGSHLRALLLAEEGLEAVKNIRDDGFSYLLDGIYGLSTSSNVWNLSTSSDSIGGFSRKIEISSFSDDIKLVTSTVSWKKNLQRDESVSLVTLFSNWMERVSDWSNPNSLDGSGLDLAGNQDGRKVAFQDGYIYLVRAGGTPDFAVIDVGLPSSPVLSGSLSLPGNPTNIFVSGIYAYVSSDSNNSELQIIDISIPSAPVLVGSLDLGGNANANGVFVLNEIAYVVRDNAGVSGDMHVIDVSNPEAPVLQGSINTLANGYEIYVSGSFAFVASSDNAQELKVIDVSNPLSPAIVGSYNATGNTDALTITGLGTSVFVGQGTSLRAIDVSNPLSPALLTTYSAGSTITDTALGSGNSYLFISSSGGVELQIVDATDPSTLAFIGNFDDTIAYNGIVFSDDLDRVFVATASNTAELKVIQP